MIGRLTKAVVALAAAATSVAVLGSSSLSGRAAPLSPRHLSAASACSAASRELAFGALKRIDVVALGRKQVARVTRPPRGLADSQPEWSPSGSQIAFVRAGRRKFRPVSDIYVVGANGRGLRRLTRTGAAASPLWSPNGRQIAFESGGAGFAVAAGGGKAKRLAPRASALAWSPDGHRLASPAIGRSGLSSGIMLLQANGTGRKLITRGSDSGPAWSPDGKLIAFVTGTGKAGGIAVVGPDGRGRKQLTHGPDYDPAWSADGRQLLFDEVLGSSDTLYVIGADGGKPRRLTRAPRGEGFRDLAWSPDGKWVSFTLGPQIGHSGHAYDVFLVRPDGKSLHSVTRRLPLGGARDIAGAVWKPCK